METKALLRPGHRNPRRLDAVRSRRQRNRRPPRDQILPPAVTARISIEAAATFGWHRWVGDRGIAYGIDHFGTSAPAGDIAKDYGFTADAIASVATSTYAFATK